ncbi:MAG: transcription repressor NadR [Selenomonas sp.]|uniref:transcription repressor NadR n=1 Tax=Selenomonas sp. TaxID=2053611 RepID=UPI0025ECD90D|nr:transcription repressor NadR [Selenomonas sp.]MCR5758577.1 transcription repressor NadR [Selenomonas sp.]
MTTEERREEVLRRLQAASQPLTGTRLSRELGVSRQIIVGDVSILRAEGQRIFATPRGYIMPGEDNGQQKITLVCRHSAQEMEAELNAIVDNGGAVLDVIVEHPVYGPLKSDLLLESRRDVKNFLTKMKKCQANPLLVVTGGIHIHTVRVPNEEVLAAIRQELQLLGILVNIA